MEESAILEEEVLSGVEWSGLGLERGVRLLRVKEKPGENQEEEEGGTGLKGRNLLIGTIYGSFPNI